MKAVEKAAGPRLAMRGRMAGFDPHLRNTLASHQEAPAAHAQPTGSAQAATALTGAKLAAVVAATTIVTGAAAAITTKAYVSKAPPITGSWANMIRIVQAGPDSYRGFMTATGYNSVIRCTWHKGVPVWQITGRGPNYTGSEYIGGSDSTGQCSRLRPRYYYRSYMLRGQQELATADYRAMLTLSAGHANPAAVVVTVARAVMC